MLFSKASNSSVRPSVSNLRIDWTLFLATLPLLAAGLVTMNSFTGQNNFFLKQVIWIAIALTAFFVCSFIDFRFLRRTGVLVGLFLISVLLLMFLFFAGHLVNGAKSWFSLGAFSFQPTDPIKIVLILILAKYFSRRHVEIAHVRDRKSVV